MAFSEEIKWEGWEAHHKTAVAAGGQDVLLNCKILCLDCHKSTYTYGKH